MFTWDTLQVSMGIKQPVPAERHFSLPEQVTACVSNIQQQLYTEQ